MSNHDELIAQFVEVSGSDENVAKFYLSSSQWSLEQALSNFCANPSDNERIDASPGVEVEGVAMETGGAAAGGKKDEFSKSASNKPRFATLNDMSKRDDDNEEEGQAFYAGGSDRSGQQVLGPPKRKNFREQLSEMFRMAQEQSGGGIDVSTGPSTSSGSSGGGVTWGQGVRLGMTDSDHSLVASAERGKSDVKKPVVVLKLWSQGFSVDDGELRQYDDPQNKEFLETIMRGEIPNELLEMGWMVNVDVEDHRHEEYKKASVKQNFRGSGHTLGSPAPKISSETVGSEEASKSSSKESVPVANDDGAKERLKLNTSEPTTTIQIRLANGSRLAAQFNLTHTVADIQQYIRDARPQYAESNFILVSSFPTRELTECDVTIEKAGLKNASIMQRIK